MSQQELLPYVQDLVSKSKDLGWWKRSVKVIYHSQLEPKRFNRTARNAYNSTNWNNLELSIMISLAEKEKCHWTCRIISEARRLFVKMNWPKFNSQECEAKKILSLSREANPVTSVSCSSHWASKRENFKLASKAISRLICDSLVHAARISDV